MGDLMMPDKYKLVDCKEVVHIDATDTATQADALKKGKIVVPIEINRQLDNLKVRSFRKT